MTIVEPAGVGLKPSGPVDREVRWERMFRDELEAAASACPVVYFPYGLCEPHGPQNTLGLDALKAHGVCCAAARTYGGIVAPADYWHVHEIGIYADFGHEWIGSERAWLTAVPPWVHFKNVCYHARAADALGFQAALFVTGHYGPNWMDLKTVLERLQPHIATRMYGLPDHEANHPGFNGKDGDHAGKVETSLLWALEPACVDVSRFAARIGSGRQFAMGPDADEADRQTGERMVADEARWLGEKASELLNDYARMAPQARTPLTFGEVEKIWAETIVPILPDFACMQKGAIDLPPSSQWAANAAVDQRWTK